MAVFKNKKPWQEVDPDETTIIDDDLYESSDSDGSDEEFTDDTKPSGKSVKVDLKSAEVQLDI